MGLLDPNLFTNPALLNQLKGLLGNMPISKLMRGEESVTQEGLLGAMRAMPVFDQQAAMGDMQYAADAMGPGAIAGTTKLVKGMTKFEKAHKLAQKNAALPIEQGGLGLPPNNTAADRARALGFDTPAYHGSKSEIKAFDLRKHGASDPGLVGKAVYAAPSKEQASEFATNPRYGRGDTSNVLPLLLKMDNPAIVDNGGLLGRGLSEWHKNGITPESSADVMRAITGAGHDAVEFRIGGAPSQYAIFNERNMRSRFAAFDPKRKDEADLLAAYFGFTIPQDNRSN